MSYLVVGPELLASAATDLTRIEQAIGAANVAALPHTSELLAAGADEVSTAVAALFSGHARVYQAVSAQATAFHDRFVQAINGAECPMPAQRPPMCSKPCSMRSMHLFRHYWAGP